MARRHFFPSDDDERRLHGLMSALPQRMPSAAFRARLLAATRSTWPRRVEGRRWGGVRCDVAISASVLAGAAMLTLAPVALVVGVFVLDAGVAVKGLAHACVLLVEWLSAGLSLWDVVARAAAASGAALASPTGTLVLVGGVLTASLALAGLSRVLPGEQGDM
jgi:hypothetical protein